MHIVVSVFGSTGDVYPQLALAKELRRRGHTLTVAAVPQWRTLVERMGLTFAPLGIDLSRQYRALQHDEIDGTVSEQQKTAIAMLAPRIFQDLQNVCLDADLLLGPADHPLALMVHEVLNIPYCSLLVVYTSGDMLRLQRSVISEIGPWRRELGLAPLKIVCPALPLVGVSPHLMLLGLSRHWLHPRPDWPAHFHVTGPWFSEDEAWDRDPGLEAFLSTGAPPVVITFGSMVHRDPEGLTRFLLQAVAQVGCRAIIQRGWSGLGQGVEPGPNVYFTDSAPHSWLFPRAGCVVHHAGSGTMTAAVLAGVPMVCVPHAFDQFDLSSFAQTFGYASAVIPYTELEAERLAGALRAALSQPTYREAAVRHAAMLRAERGVEQASSLIEAMV